jgi:hypothetical protein
MVVCAGCSSKSGTTANPCATRGATYLATFAEMSGGTCGPVPQQIVNVDSNGQITNGTSITCANDDLNGCTEMKSGCMGTTSNGCSATIQTDVTFASDGSGASGLETIQVTCGASVCSSTYRVSLARQ